MKRHLLFLLFAACIVGCTHRSTSSEMNKEEARAIMQDVSERNRAYQPLTERDDTMMQRVVSYYKEHGTSNELMEAYYLLGSVYRDLHEAPKAMEAFLEGINVADTLSDECRYDLLARLHGQMCDILYRQNLYAQAVEEDRNVYNYAVKANDTIMRVASQWERLGKCYVMCDYPTVADESWNVLEESQRLNQYQYAAGKLCTSVLACLELNRLDDARKLLEIYERHSGEVNLETHESEFPIYYYAKGRLLTALGKADSAELFFRRELKERDWDNRQAAYRGLHKVFQNENRIDSAYKYAVLQSDAVDSAYQEMLSRNLQNLHELYDYSRAQNDSFQKTLQLEQTRRYMVRVRLLFFFIILVALFLLYYLHTSYQQKIAQAELELEQANRRQNEAEFCLIELQKQMGIADNQESKIRLAQEIKQVEEENEVLRKQVQEKQERLDKLRRSVRLMQKDLRQKMYAYPLFQALLKKAKEGRPATQEDYEKIMNYLQQKDETLMARFYETAPTATSIERNVFLLMRMGLTKAEAASLTSHASNSISSMVTRLYKKIHNISPMGSAEADDWLLSL